MNDALNEMYAKLEAHFGPSGWWPAETPFEIAVGAILTQNTAWGNVEKAIANLKQRKLLSAKAIVACPTDALEDALRPSGFFRVKAQRLRTFCAWLIEHHGGSMKRLAERPLAQLRPELLAVSGLGPETVDDILLYACLKPVFVVDAYTQRIFHRHGLITAPVKYETLRAFCESNLEADVARYAAFHGYLVYAGNRYCRRVPRCETCPLGCTLEPGQPLPLPPASAPRKRPSRV